MTVARGASCANVVECVLLSGAMRASKAVVGWGFGWMLTVLASVPSARG